MQSLEAAYEEGEVTPSLCDCLFKMVCTHNRSFKKAKLSSQRSSLSAVLDNVPTYNDSPHSSACSTTTTPQKPQFCIHTKLLELYLEESAKDPNQLKTGLKRNTHLLEKLVARERLNTIILNLYPGNKGYSITFPTSPLSDTCTDDTAEMIETKKWDYEDTELLHYLDLEELPAFIVDLLEPAHSFLFYSGCIVAKVRDYRMAFPAPKCDIHHVLLRPTAQSILADVHKIAEEWSADDKAQLESRIILAHHPTLCLDIGTSHSLAARTSRLHHNRHLLNTHRIRRAAMKYSQVTVYRKKKLVSHTYRPGLELFEYLTRARTRPKSGAPMFAKTARREEVRPIPAPSLETTPILPPTGGVNITEFKAYSPAREFRESGDAAAFPQFMENCQPQLVEEYVLETDMHSKEPDKRRVYQMKLSILQRPLNGEYLGELYLDRDHKKGERNGVASRFSLGTRVQANRYIQQFTEIFTESGRKSVRVNYCFAQNHPQVCFKVQNQPAPQVVSTQPPSTPQPNYSLSYQTLPGANSVVNGTVNLVPTQQPASASVPLLQAQLQTNKQTQDANSEHAFSVLATKLMNSVQQIQPANAKQASQKSTCSNAAIINILNRSPASNINSDANAAVVNAINNSQLLAAQQQAVQTKLVGRKITVANMPANARVLNAANVISMNNNRSMADGTLHATQQQITLTTVAGNNFFNTVTVPKPTARSNNDGGKAALSALLVGTAAADRPDISPANTNSLLLEKLAGVSSASNKNPASPTFIQSPKQYVVHSPKISPLASPPPQTQTINVQGLNYTTIQGLQGVQVQLPGFAQPMRAFLNVTSTGGLQGQSLLVSVPVTTTANSAGGGASQCVNNNNSSVANAISVGSMGTPTVVLAANTGTSNLAQLVTTGVKRVGAQGTMLAQNNAPLQLVTPIQRPRQIQQAQQLQHARVQFQQQHLQQVQRQTPITFKMATTGGTVAAQAANVAQQVQKQFQHQQVQLQLNQQQFLQQTTAQPQHIHLNKIARRSSQNVSDPP